MSDFDIAIVGGGLVGISLACALGQLEPAPRVVLIEAHDYSKLPPPGFDSRTVALSFSSRQIFAAMGIWSDLAEQVSAINTIHISDRGHPGITHLSAVDQHVEALGYVIENRHLGQSLYQAMLATQHVTIMAPATVKDLNITSDQASLTIEADGTKQKITTRLVVAADGSDSFVRQQQGIELKRLEYHQTAVIANVATSKAHQNIAYERFTHTGPMALLPLNAYETDQHRYGLVWTLPDAEVETVMNLSDDEFAAELTKRFGNRVGQFTRIGQRASYPLGLTYVSEHVRHRLAFIGNAAHTLHPVAGQGFNLGLRDVAALVEVIGEAQKAQKDIGDISVLQEYASWRRKDHKITIAFTDAIVRIFSNNFKPLVIARNAGLMAMEMFAPVRRKLTKHAMGYIGKASMLARGLDLKL